MRRSIKPSSDEYKLLKSLFLLPPAGQGLTIRAALAEVHRLGWDISRGTIDNYRREILGAGSTRAYEQVMVAMDGPTNELRAGAVSGPAVGPVMDVDPLVNLERQMARALEMAAVSADPTLINSTLRAVTSCARQIEQLRNSRAPDQVTRVHIYLPEERPDPHECDPNDPASWPARAA